MPRTPLEALHSPPPNRAATGELEARRGPVDSGGDRAQHLPQKLPHALAVLVRLTFDYPEPSFTHTADDLSATAASMPATSIPVTPDPNTSIGR